MAIHAVFEHQDGYKFEQVYTKKSSFLRSLKSKDATFLNGVDMERAVVIYPSNLPDYRRMK